MPDNVPDVSPAAGPMTVDTALGNAGRLLHWAEAETDLVRMERLEKLADSWADIARVLLVRDQDHA